MCGVAGVLSSEIDLQSASARRTLAAMQAAISHRGPDGQGDYISPSGNAAICHTRLAIIDLSDAGAQPMISSDQRYAITFNGEIYNYQELRTSLEQQGEHFTSDSDTEVLLKLYALEGERCVDRLRGMFAFLIWDEHTQQGFAARDPLGIKPLYYLYTNNALAFASELRCLMQAQLHSNQLSASGLKSYFQTGTVAEPNTLLDDAQLLPAGHTLSWRANEIETAPYWQIEFKNQAMQRQQAVELTRKALESSVQAHLVSDVPVGIFLSGGIDSTALVALATKMSTAPVNTYSIAFTSPEWNEGEVAARVAEHFGTRHTEFLITPDIAKPLFKEFLNAVDQPTIDGFNTFCISKLASQAGAKVVLSGVGGDELFAGYKSFELLPKMLKLSTKLKWFSPIFNWLNKSLSRWLPSKVVRSLDFLSAPASLSAAYQSLRCIFSQREASALCEQYQLRPLEVSSAIAINDSNLLDQISKAELSLYMRNQLLRDSDVMSMACGLELRVPLVDKELFESIAKIPTGLRLRMGKKLLVEAVPELPDWVINRPKQGFRFPFDEWFNDEWSKLKTHYKAPSWMSLTPWYRRWSLVVLEHWQTHCLRTDVAKAGGKN